MFTGQELSDILNKMESEDLEKDLVLVEGILCLQDDEGELIKLVPVGENEEEEDWDDDEEETDEGRFELGTE